MASVLFTHARAEKEIEHQRVNSGNQQKISCPVTGPGLSSFQESCFQNTEWLAVVHDHSFPASSGPPSSMFFFFQDPLSHLTLKLSRPKATPFPHFFARIKTRLTRFYKHWKLESDPLIFCFSFRKSLIIERKALSKFPLKRYPVNTKKNSD